MKKYNVKLLNKNFEKLPSDLKNTLNQPVIILSGKMASGKNYVCSLLEKFGYSSVDADILVHQAIDKSKNKILETFSESAGKENILILDQNGNINRRSLGKLLFTHPELLAKQEAIVYPIITQMIDDFIQEHKKTIINATVAYKSPQIMEKSNLIIFVQSNCIKRFLRARKRDKLPPSQIIKRFNSQKKLIKNFTKADKEIIIIKN